MFKSLFIGCAGAGSNIVEHLKNGLPKVEHIDYVTIDTSNVNKKEGIDFIHIKEDSNGDKVLSGSGGVRGSNLEDIKKGVDEFITNYKLHRFDGIVYLVFSSNGGSGNVIASVLLRELLSNDVAVASIVVHDVTSKQYAGQALGTIKSLNKLALDTKRAIPMIYYNNTANTDETGTELFTMINNIILAEVKMIVEYNDLDNLVDIDREDMRNFYMPTKYNIASIPPGIYGISALKYGALDSIVSNYDVIIGRCLTTKNTDHFRQHFLPQYKKGNNILTNPETMLLLINNFKKHYELLEAGFNKYDKKIEVFTPKNDDDIMEF